MRSGIYIAFLAVGLGWSIASCGAEDAETATTDQNAAKVENPNTAPEDTLQPITQVQWYDGEEPTDSDKLQLLSDFLSGKQQFDFYVVFTEPFWTFYFFGNEVLFSAADFDVPEVWPIEYPFTDEEDEQALSFMRNGEFWQFMVKKGSGSDGMSELEYPYSVTLDSFVGGGGTSFVRGEQ